MGILMGVISTLFLSIGTIFWKKSLSFKCPTKLFSIFSYLIPIFFIITFLIFGKISFENANINLFLIPVIIILSYVSIQIWQYVYKNEKISVITPYENINKILSIIIAFFIFSDVSLPSLLITLFAGIIVIIGSIDFKTLELPKLLKVFLVCQISWAVVLLLVGHVLKNSGVSEITYYSINVLLFILLFILILLKTKEYKQIKELPKQFYTNRLASSFLGSLNDIITLFIISSLGVTISILFSYMYIGFVLIMSYIVFKDKPSKKNIILTIVLSLLVGLGYYFK